MSRLLLAVFALSGGASAKENLPEGAATCQLEPHINLPCWLITFCSAVALKEQNATRAHISSPPLLFPPTDASLRIGIKHRVEGCTRRAKDGDELSMHYTGTLYRDGSKFDSSVDRSSPFDFTLGRGSVIKGWDQGLQGMCEGEKRKLTIPSNLGYGSRGSPPKIQGGDTVRISSTWRREW